MKATILSFLFICSALTLAAQGEKNFIDQNYIEVTGHAEMQVVPDEIYLNIQLNDKDVKGKSLSEIEKSMYDALQQLGIDIAKDLAVKDVSSNFKNYWILKTGIVLSKEYQLRVHDARTAGKVIVALQQLGISNVSIDRVDHSHMDALRMEVKVNAIKAAQEKAQALAQAIHQNIGKAIYIQELNYNAYMPMLNKSVNMMVRGAAPESANNAPEPNIEFEKIKLEYSILVRFALQ